MHPDQDVAVILLFTGRFLHGLADSLGVSPAIIMVSEVSTVKLRGIFMNSVSIAACSGIPLAYIIGRCVISFTRSQLSLLMLEAFNAYYVLYRKDLAHDVTISTIVGLVLNPGHDANFWQQ